MTCVFHSAPQGRRRVLTCCLSPQMSMPTPSATFRSKGPAKDGNRSEQRTASGCYCGDPAGRKLRSGTRLLSCLRHVSANMDDFDLHRKQVLPSLTTENCLLTSCPTVVSILPHIYIVD